MSEKEEGIGKRYEAPKCCKKPMSLVAVMKIDYTFGRFFQCGICGGIVEFQTFK